MEENKFLKITKPDGTVHFVPYAEKSKNRYEKTNMRTTEKLKIEEISESEMNELIDSKKLIDKDYKKSKSDLATESAAKDAEIEALKAQLAQAQKSEVKTESAAKDTEKKK